MKRINILAVMLIISGMFWGSSTHFAEAGMGENTSGFAWGGGAATNGPGYEGMGWLSFNSLDCDANGNGTVEAAEVTARPGCSAGPIANYGVVMPMANGALSGYAWSEHYGWVSFNAGDLAGCAPALAAATRTGNSITGGARILAIRDAGVNAGGFDGCISLSSSVAPVYGVSIVGNALSGYAWSSDLGWIDFSGVTFQAPNTLKVCEGGTVRGIDTTPSTPMAMVLGSSQDLTAYYGSAIGCSGTDVTATSTTWTEGGGAAITLTPGFVGGKKRVTAGTVGTESFTASYSGLTTSVSATVSCVETVSCANETLKVCLGETVSGVPLLAGTCGPVDCNGAAGTRNCEYNWKEVAP